MAKADNVPCGWKCQLEDNGPWRTYWERSGPLTATAALAATTAPTTSNVAVSREHVGGVLENGWL